MRGTWIQSLGWEDPLEENMATHSSILARRKNGQRSLAGCSLLGLQRVNMTEATKHSTGSMTGQVKWDRISESLENQMCVCVLAQSCPNLCDSMDCSTPGTSFYEISQARILAWVAISFSRESSWPRDQTGVSCPAGRFFTNWATREAPYFKMRLEIEDYLGYPWSMYYVHRQSFEFLTMGYTLSDR